MPYHVYMMNNYPGGALYIGVTSDLIKRVTQHKEGTFAGFTKQYDLKSLVYYEEYQEVREAIAREKAMKKWRRSWKVDKIVEINPSWKDLSEEF
jgi:putative endonuclease